MEVEKVRRGTAISAVYGTVRIEPAFVIRIRAQNTGFIQLADSLSAGRGAIGKTLKKGELLATIADETTARQLKQARADLEAERERAKLDVPSTEPLKIAEANEAAAGKIGRAEQHSRGRIRKSQERGEPFARRREDRKNRTRAKSGIADERGAKTRSANEELRNSSLRWMGFFPTCKVIDGELVTENNQLFTISSRRNYVRGEVNEEDIGEVKIGMKAVVQLYAYRTRQFNGQSQFHSACGRSGHAALHSRAGAAKSAGKSDGRHDRRNEHHHRHA